MPEQQSNKPHTTELPEVGKSLNNITLINSNIFTSTVLDPCELTNRVSKVLDYEEEPFKKRMKIGKTPVDITGKSWITKSFLVFLVNDSDESMLVSFNGQSTLSLPPRMDMKFYNIDCNDDTIEVSCFSGESLYVKVLIA